jgi:serine/threonine-protein kinase
VFGTRQGLMRVSAAGGAPQALTKVAAEKGELMHEVPQYIPGSQAIIFTVLMSGSNDRIAVFDPGKAAYRVVVNDGTIERYVPTGHLVYTRAGALFGVPFDARRLVVTGPETPLIEGISTAGLATVGGMNYAISDSGLLVYVENQQGNNRILGWMDRQGSAQPSSAPPRAYREARLSPDGKRVAATVAGADFRSSDIWICELERGTLTRLTFAGSNFNPAWTPDGRHVTFSWFQLEKSGIYRVAADGSGKPELLSGNNGGASATTFTPDGKVLVYSSRSPGQSDSVIWTRSLDGRAGENKPRPFLQTGFREESPQLSPDGRWLAYQSNESGKFEIYVRPFPDPGGKVAISTQGGALPRWSHSGRELFYQDPQNRIMAVDVETTPAFRAGQPRALFELHADAPAGNSSSSQWDVAPDGKRFLVFKAPEGQETGTKLQVVENWFEELRRRIPSGGK